MTTTKLLIAIFGAACVISVGGAGNDAATDALDKFNAVRPSEEDLAIYQLDWLPTLKSAKERAAKEGRPIFLVVVRNSFGDLCSGHC